VLGPILAIQVQEYLESRREDKRRKHQIFRELMVTRATMLSPRHVEALNAIQIEFSAKAPEEKPIVDEWQPYINHLSHMDKDNLPAWNAKSIDLLIDLLFEMAALLGYHDFNRVRIKNEAYLPQYFGDIENEQNRLRKAPIKVFEGDQSLKVEVAEAPVAPSTPIPRRPS
jgi:hypothetical protein